MRGDCLLCSAIASDAFIRHNPAMGDLAFAVFGTGAVGGYFGGRLAQAGEDVRFVARGWHLAAIREHGLRVSSVDGDFVVSPAQVTDDPVALGPVDVVILGVKAWQVPHAAEAMRPLVGERTFVVPLQNGIEAPDQLATVLGAECVLGGLCRILAWVERPDIRVAMWSKFLFIAALSGPPLGARGAGGRGRPARRPSWRSRAGAAENLRNVAAAGA